MADAAASVTLVLDGLPESFRAAIADDDVEALAAAATDPHIYAKIIQPVVDAFAGLPKGLALTAAEAKPKAGAARWQATVLQWMAYQKAKPSQLVKAVARMVHELVQALTSWKAVLDSVSSMDVDMEHDSDGTDADLSQPAATLAQSASDRLAATLHDLPAAVAGLTDEAAAAAEAEAAADPSTTQDAQTTDPGVEASITAVESAAMATLVAADAAAVVRDNTAGTQDGAASMRSLALTDGGDDEDDEDDVESRSAVSSQGRRSSSPGRGGGESESKASDATPDVSAARRARLSLARPGLALPLTDTAEDGSETPAEHTPVLRGLSLLPTSRRPTMGNLLASSGAGASVRVLSDAEEGSGGVEETSAADILAVPESMRMAVFAALVRDANALAVMVDSIAEACSVVAKCGSDYGARSVPAGVLQLMVRQMRDTLVSTWATRKSVLLFEASTMQVRSFLRVEHDRRSRAALVASAISASVDAMRAAETEWTRRKQVVVGREEALVKWEKRIQEMLTTAKTAFSTAQDKVNGRLEGMQALLDQRTLELEEERIKSERLAEAGKAKEFFRARSRAAEAELVRERAVADGLRKQLQAMRAGITRRG